MSHIKINTKYKYIAQDKDGSVYIYTKKPTCESSSFVCFDIAEKLDTNIFDVYLGDDWKESLHRIQPDGITFEKIGPLLQTDDLLLIYGGRLFRYFSHYDTNDNVCVFPFGADSITSDKNSGTIVVVSTWEKVDKDIIKQDIQKH